ncbi:transglutaminase family protein [Geobacter argillaceus]|uniref:Transglutaminase superfamily protein n=1 Tax=Geobacter argillaceus TaxID=345631 RepID=A0A562VKB9_9BACT|nr:transglutaminaseTgpA domain-containing protein [Geobacter argillaceus]TWJ18379.1 transglutaminase superfamily protein [Geobacter argillaceus]
MVRIETILQFLIAGVALLGFIPLAPWLDRLPMVLVPFALVWGLYAHRWGKPIPGRMATPLAIIIFFLYAIRVSPTNLVAPAANLLALLLAVRLATPRSARHHLQIIALAIFCLAASSLFSLDATFLVCLVLQLILAAVSLVFLTVADTASDTAFGPGQLRTLIASALVLPLATAPLMALFFLILPRTQFPLWNALAGASAGATTGLSEHIAPGSSATIAENRVVAFRAAMPAQDPERLYWRGIVLNSFDGTAWVRKSPPPEMPAIPAPGSITQEIYLEGIRSPVLPTLNIPRQLTGMRVQASPDLVFRPAAAGRGTLRYSVTSVLLDAVAVPRGIDRTFYRQLPPALPPRLKETGRRIAREATGDEHALALVEQFFRQQKISYGTTGLPTGPTALDLFLFEKRTGHCEFFATSCALLLRQAGVPARLVGGYLGGTYNDLGQYYVVTEDRAHVWVELFIEGRGWVTVDPSRWAVNFTQARIAPPPGFLKRIALILDTGSYYWNVTVINYDLERQFSTANRLVTMSRGLRLTGPGRWIWPVLLSGATLLLMPFLTRQYRTSREERLVRKVLARVRRVYGIVPTPDTGLHALAGEFNDPALCELVERYGAIVFQGRRLNRREASRLRQLCRQIGRRKKGLQSNEECD